MELVILIASSFNMLEARYQHLYTCREDKLNGEVLMQWYVCLL
jgi:hypothetical protein